MGLATVQPATGREEGGKEDYRPVASVDMAGGAGCESGVGGAQYIRVPAVGAIGRGIKANLDGNLPPSLAGDEASILTP